MKLDHANAVAMNADLYEEYRALDPVDAVAVVQEIAGKGEDWHTDDTLVKLSSALRGLARVVPFIENEFSGVVVRGEAEDTFDVFFLDEDQLFVGVRQGVRKGEVSDAFLVMGMRYAMFPTRTMVSAAGSVYHEVRDAVASVAFTDEQAHAAVLKALETGAYMVNVTWRGVDQVR